MKKRISLLAVMLLIFGFVYSQPKGISEIVKIKTTSPKSQARAGTCWAFATTSFIETEVIRMTGNEFDLSETFFVYYAYINRAKIYLKLHGTHTFGQGGQAHDVINVVREHGIVLEKDYPYLLKNHTDLERKLKTYVDSINKLKEIPVNWLDGYKEILNEKLGTPPQKVAYNGKDYSPKDFATDVLKFEADNYVEITSFKYKKYYNPFVLEVPDNWSLDLYYNVTMKDYLAIINNALVNNYSVNWDGDVSEKGFNSKTSLATMEKVDINDYDNYHQQLFNSRSTTDDHLMHAVGLYKKNNGEYYYLIKNSWGEYGAYKGFLYMSQDFVTMKSIAITVHKNAIPSNIKIKLNIN